MARTLCPVGRMWLPAQEPDAGAFFVQAVKE